MNAIRVLLPILQTDEVLHIGSLDPIEKRRHFQESLEGPCLSVSTTPHAWTAIAQLGGQPWHRLCRIGGAFIDAIACKAQSHNAKALQRWAEAEGWVTPVLRWRARYRDEEWDDEITVVLDSEEEARETLIREGQDHDPEPFMDVWSPSPALLQRLGQTTIDGFDGVLMMVVEDLLPDVDGVWWQERYDPDRYGAPRGGILPSRVHAWSSQRILDQDIKDDPLNMAWTQGVQPVALSRRNDRAAEVDTRSAIKLGAESMKRERVQPGL